jgi:hypothetical protein
MNMATKAQKAKDAAKQLSRYHRLMERQKTYKFGPAYEVGTRAVRGEAPKLRNRSAE